MSWTRSATGALWLFLTACAPDGDPETGASANDDSPAAVSSPGDGLRGTQPEIMPSIMLEPPASPVPAAEPAQDAPMARGCLKQDDCPEGLVCVALTLRDLRCMEYQPAPPRTGSRGRPVPPVGLLDGTAMRAQMGVTP